MDPLVWLRKHLEEADTNLLREMVGTFVQMLTGAEADAICGAAYGERSADRVNRRNGYRGRRFDTRTGTISLAVPKLRSGSYFPDRLLEPRRRAERALVQVVAECYVRGVPTRRLDGLVKTLGIEGISRSQVSELAESLDEAVAAFRSRPLDQGPYTYLWIDALTQKAREGGRIVNVAAVVATAVNADGHREILGLGLVTTEDGPIPASSGQTQRHRLNRGGNRQLDRALHTVALVQVRVDPRAIAYLERKRTEGKTRAEGVRCMKRHLANVVFAVMLDDASRGVLDRWEFTCADAAGERDHRHVRAQERDPAPRYGPCPDPAAHPPVSARAAYF